VKALPPTPELKRLARRVIWFEPPSRALADAVRLAAYTMTYGTVADVVALRRHLSDDDLRQALAQAPPGIFDARSWAYWHLKLNGRPAPPLPRRRLRKEPPGRGRPQQHMQRTVR
jgi:hypothetical protein